MVTAPRRPSRKKGVPNRATIQRSEEARIAMENSRGAGKKLGKEVLEDFMHLFAGMAAHYQPIPEGQPVPPGRHPDENRFLVYAKLAVDTASDLAGYQSPKFRAIMVSVAPGAGDPSIPRQDDPNKIIDINDPARLARIYQNRVKQIAKS